MAVETKRRVPVLVWPFWAIWRLIALIVEFMGRMVAFVLGLGLLIAGVVLSVTVIGAVVGIPLAVIGVLLIIRSLF